MPFTQFESTDPIVVPPSPEKTYDKLWMVRMIVRAGSPSEKATIMAEFVPCRDNEDTGNKELKPEITEDEKKMIKIDDLFALAASDIGFATAIEGVFQALNAYAISHNIF